MCPPCKLSKSFSLDYLFLISLPPPPLVLEGFSMYLNTVFALSLIGLHRQSCSPVSYRAPPCQDTHPFCQILFLHPAHPPTCSPGYHAWVKSIQSLSPPPLEHPALQFHDHFQISPEN